MSDHPDSVDAAELDRMAQSPYAFTSDFRLVEVSCKIKVNGETVTAAQRIDAGAWEAGGDAFRKSVMAAVQQHCALEVVKKFPPTITVRT